MFYYLLYNSSFSFIVENRLFSTILYGSILYVLTHAILNYCNIEILTIINNYFWIIFTLDIISLSYGIYQVYINPSQDIYSRNTENNNNNNTNNNLSVSFNLLKNKINTLLDRKNDLTISQINTTPNNIQQQYSQPQPQTQTHTQTHTQTRQSRQNTQQQGTNKFSTPISQLQNKLNSMEMEMDMDMDIDNGNGNGNTNTASTPINLIRQKQNIPEPIINEDGYAESVAGSDLGSIMDLDDFEKSL
jgi:hypothetical protein